MTIVEQVGQLGFPTGQYAVFGSGLLAVYGLREANDTDIVVLPELFDKLMDRPGWDLEISLHGTRILRHSQEAVEVFDEWLLGSYRQNASYLIADAHTIEGVSFVHADKVLHWKQGSSREKDRQDAVLLQRYLQHAYAV